MVQNPAMPFFKGVNLEFSNRRRERRWLGKVSKGTGSEYTSQPVKLSKQAD